MSILLLIFFTARWQHFFRIYNCERNFPIPSCATIYIDKTKFMFYDRWNSLRRPIRSHANDKISLREASLNCAIDQSRRKHETLRVNEWETMYGEKIPTTLIKKLQGLRRRDCTGGGRRASSIVQSMTDRPFRY